MKSAVVTCALMANGAQEAQRDEDQSSAWEGAGERREGGETRRTASLVISRARCGKWSGPCLFTKIYAT